MPELGSRSSGVAASCGGSLRERQRGREWRREAEREKGRERERERKRERGREGERERERGRGREGDRERERGRGREGGLVTGRATAVVTGLTSFGMKTRVSRILRIPAAQGMVEKEALATR